MEKNLKNFQFLKIKKALKNKNFSAFAVLTKHGDIKKYNDIKQKLHFYNFNCIKVKNNTVKKVLNKSIFKHQENIFSGQLIIITIDENINNQNKLNLFELKKIFKTEIFIMSVKLNKNFFLFSCINKLNIVSYKTSNLLLIKNFKLTLKTLTKQAYMTQGKKFVSK